MFGIGTQEVLIILLVTLLLFGGRKIPEVARSLGNGLREVRKAVQSVQREVDLEAMMRAEPSEERRDPRPTAPPLPGADADATGAASGTDPARDGPGTSRPAGEGPAARHEPCDHAEGL